LATIFPGSCLNLPVNDLGVGNLWWNGEAMVIIDEFAEVLFLLLFLLDTLLKLFEFSNELLLSLMLLFGTHQKLLCVNLPADFLLIVKRLLNYLMI